MFQPSTGRIIYTTFISGLRSCWQAWHSVSPSRPPSLGHRVIKGRYKYIVVATFVRLSGTKRDEQRKEIRMADGPEGVKAD